MVGIGIELKRERIVIRYKDKKWSWILEPRYWRNTIIWTTILLILPAAAYIINPVLANTIVTANIYAAIAIPMGLMTLGTGRLNFGPNFFIGIGGYAAALLSIHAGWGPLATLPVAIIASMFFALMFSPLVIVAKGLYYVLITLLLPQVFFEITTIYSDIFKGDTGLFGIIPLVDIGDAKANFMIIAYISTGIMLLYLLVINKIYTSRYGLIMATINDDEDVAHGIGVNINKIKILSFVFASGMIGVSGWFFAHYFSTFSGQTFLTLSYMTKILLVIFIGGRVKPFGAIVGAYFIAFLETFLTRVMGPIQAVIFPILLLILLFALPEGLFGLYRKRHYREYLPTMHVRR